MDHEFKGANRARTGPRSRPAAQRSARRYDSAGRREAAEKRRLLVLDAARARFLSDGFVATTVAQVARDAEVSPEFIYKAFGSKAELAAAVWDRALAGRGERPAYTRSDEVSSSAHDPRVILRNWAVLSAEVSELGAPLQAMMRAAAQVDADAARMFTEVERQREARMTHNAAYLIEGGHVRPGLTADQVRDILLLVAGELYESLVLHRGWPTDAYIELAYRFLASTLLPE
ncbi:TetR/AcrR family transcriptional regulator [Raineyella fluvialis]|nr:TetR/AcrR family transcriptional regulator [Raineyella fluvialis]